MLYVVLFVGLVDAIPRKRRATHVMQVTSNEPCYCESPPEIGSNPRESGVTPRESGVTAG